MTKARPLLVGLFAMLVATTFADRAHADSHDVELRYTKNAGAEHCPDEAALKESVLEHLGYDPFIQNGARVIVVTIDKSGKGLRAQIDRVDSQGAVIGTSAVDSTSSACKELASSIALAVSIAIDPLHGSAIARPAPPAPPPPPAPPAPPVVIIAPSPSKDVAPSPIKTDLEKSRFQMIVSAAILSGIGASPSISIGAEAEARLRKDDLSLGLGARASAPSSANADGSSGAVVTSSIVVGTIVPCFHLDVVAVCASSQFGALLGDATNIAHHQSHATFFSALGGRGVVAWPIGNTFSLGGYLEVLATLTPTTLQINGVEAWQTSIVSGSLGIQASAHFP